MSPGDNRVNHGKTLSSEDTGELSSNQATKVKRMFSLEDSLSNHLPGQELDDRSKLSPTPPKTLQFITSTERKEEQDRLDRLRSPTESFLVIPSPSR